MKRYLLLFAILFIAAGLLAQAPTISSLSVTGTTLKWYNASTGGTQYTDPANTALVNGQIYYASQTVNGVESATRVAITATLITQAAPTTGTHTPSQTQVVWNWNTVTGATGYKWSTANLYSGATDLSNVLTKTETSLTCNTAYTRYVWAYNSSGCVSAVTTLSQTTSSCVAAPAITTNAVTNIGSTTATLNGNITSINGANATTRGFKYSTTNGFNPASAGTNISETGSYSTGSYSLIPSGLTSTTTYYVVAYATNSAGTAYGSQVSFTTIVYSVWTFTNAGATGYTGPTQAQVNSVYSGTSLAGGVTISSGKQYWAVPVTGTYRIEAYGAQGGNVGAYTGGLGAKISGEFNLTAGEVIHIIAGQQGVAAGSGSGGGGGSFAVKTPFNTNGSVLVIGGGGGGSLSYVPGAMNGYSGLAGNSGGTTSNPGGSDLTGCFGPGAGGTNGNGGTQGCAAGGGGFFGNGVDGGHQAAGGVAFVSGGNGGISTNGGGLTHGGFGCGGAGSPSNGYGGGGGGYSGGGGGGWNGTSAGNGGGGGSYNAGTNQTNTAGSNSGHGQVIITKL